MKRYGLLMTLNPFIASETRTVQRTVAARELYVSFPMKLIGEADLTLGQLLDIAGSFERKGL